MCPTTEAPADKPVPLVLPRVKPLSERTMGIKPWETSSSSPFGGSRWGGSDRRRFVFSPDGNVLATEDAGGWQLEVWDVPTGKSLGRFGQIKDPVVLAFSPDGKALVTSGGDRSGDACPIDLWGLTARKRLRSLDEGINEVPFLSVAVSPDGKTIALAGHWPTIELLDLASGDEVGRLEGLVPREGQPDRRIDCLEFSPDGKSLALWSDHEVVLAEVATGKERCRLGTLPAHPGEDSSRPSPSLAFAPDGRCLALGGWDGLIRLWDPMTDYELLPLAGHQGGTSALRFLKDGQTLLSYGWDNQLRTWPVAQTRKPWPRPTLLAASDLTRFWDDLGSAIPLRRYEAIRVLAGSPTQVLPFLRGRLKPVPMVDSARLDRLVAGVSNGEFNERKKAAAELRKLGELAVPALDKADRGNNLVNRLREELTSLSPTREQVQALQAIHVLEQIGSDEARGLLGAMSKGALASRLTRQAKQALARLEKGARPLAADAKIERLWTFLADEDARPAFQAMRSWPLDPGKACLSCSAACGLWRPQKVWMMARSGSPA